jgi:2-polyprenyl-3-methyl-5-hydroxy-6-metoxy-1,4-benzoquinol methylase
MNEHNLEHYYEHGGAKSDHAIATILQNIGSANLGRVLDVGCGNGKLLDALSRRSSELTGIDASAAAIELARKRVPKANLMVADVQHTLPFSDAAFDIVFMLDVLEHLQSPVRAVSEAGRVLRPGGRLAITTPNANSPMRYVRGKNWFGVADPGHVSLYTSFTLSHLLERSRLRILRRLVEPFTGTFADPVLRVLRVGGTLFVVAEKA